MKETILLVDDDSAVRKVARRHLTEAGYNVLEARSPDEAIRLSEAHAGSISLLLSDLILPEMSGQELIKHISGLRADIKVLLISGYIDDELLDGGTPFLQKPFSGETLVSAVQKLLVPQAS